MSLGPRTQVAFATPPVCSRGRPALGHPLGSPRSQPHGRAARAANGGAADAGGTRAALVVGVAAASAAAAARERRLERRLRRKRDSAVAVRSFSPFQWLDKKLRGDGTVLDEASEQAKTMVSEQDSREYKVSFSKDAVRQLPSFEELDLNNDGVITKAEYNAILGKAREEDAAEAAARENKEREKDKEREEDKLMEELKLSQSPASQAAAPPAQTPPANDDVTDILQFDAGVYFVEEEEGSMTMDVMRLGTMNGDCSVKYKTMDGSAVAGIRYEHVEGELHFGDKETCKSVTVPIIEGDTWATTLEFKIMLYDPVGCELGRYLFVSRVKVIDGDSFPTNRFNKEIEERGLAKLTKGEGAVNPAEVLIEYFKLNSAIGDVGSKTYATIAVDQMQNLYFLLTVNLLKYVADDVLAADANPETFLIPGDRQDTLFLVGALYLVPYAVLNALDVWKSQLGLAEDSKAYLRENMFRKFMNYDASSRDKVPSSERVLAMTKDTDDIVDEGYMKALEITKSLGKLAVSSYFIVTENPEGVAPIAIFAGAIFGFLWLKGDEPVKLETAISRQESAIVSTTQDSAAKYRLIADYLMRPLVQDKLEGNVKSLTKASIPVTTLETTNDYFPGWLANILTAGYVIYGGEEVVAGRLQIGAFLATSGVIKDVGDSFADIFKSLLSMSKAIEPIQDITLFMNLPTDLRAQKKINRQRRKRTKEERRPERLAELRRLTGVRFATDAIPIQVRDVQFQYPGTDKLAIEKFDLQCPQGSLVAVVGPRREGKSTVMRLLGMVVAPTNGELFVPAHLRILHVSQQPILLNATPWENLAIGKQYWKDNDLESNRVITICRRLGLNPALLQHLEDTREQFLENGTTDPPSARWTETLNSSDAALIHLGRAFIYNPEVLVIHRPTLLLSGRSSEVVLEMLREFVDERGVELPVDNSGRRRPRTAIASFARAGGVQLADTVWGVQKGVVSEIPKDQVSDLLLA